MYDVARDIVMPLLGPAVAIIVPTILFFVIPRRRDRQRAALDLFTAYWAEDMRRCRLEVWAYFVTDVRGNPDEQTRRFDQFLDLLTGEQVTISGTPQAPDLFLKASRVLDFLALVEGCIQQGLVNEGLIRSFLGHYYLWWRDNILVRIWQRKQFKARNPRFVPLWWEPLVHLDRAVGVPA